MKFSLPSVLVLFVSSLYDIYTVNGYLTCIFACYVLGLYISGSLPIAFLNGTSKSHTWASTG